MLTIQAYYEQLLYNKKLEVSDLLRKNDELMFRLDETEEKNELLHSRIDQLSESDPRTQSRSSNGRSRMQPPPPRQLHRVLDQVNNIKRTLGDSNPESRHGHRISMSALESSLGDEASNVEAFSNLLRQIQAYVSEHMEEFKVALLESEKARTDYDELLRVHTAMKSTFENSMRRQDDFIDEYEEQLAEKQEQVNGLALENKEMINTIRALTQGLTDAENTQTNFYHLEAYAAETKAELAELAHSRDTIAKELASLAQDYEDLRLELEKKDKDYQSLNLDYSNCETELSVKDAEIKALQDRVKSLKAQLDSYIAELEKDAAKPAPSDELSRSFNKLSINDNESLGLPESKELIAQVLKGVQECYNKNTTLETLSEQVREVFESMKEFDSIVEQLHEANKTNSEISTLLDEKDSKIEILDTKVKSAVKDASTLKETIKALESKIASTSSSDDLKKIQDLEENIKALETNLDTEAQLTAELVQVKDQLEKATEDLNILNEDILEFESKNAELAGDLEKEISEREHLQEENAMLREDAEATEKILGNQNQERLRLVTEIKDLKVQVSDLESELAEQAKKNKGMSKRIKDLSGSQEDLIEEIEKKNQVLGDLVKERGKLSRDLEMLTHNYSEETSKSSSLERQVLSLMQASSNSSLNSSSGGTVIKQQTYQRMLDLDKEVQVQREKMKTLELELKEKNKKYSKRGSDFFVVLSEVLSAVNSASADKAWQAKLSEAMDEIRRNPGAAVDNCNKLGNFICDGVKTIGDRCARFEETVTKLKKEVQALQQMENHPNLDVSY